MASEKSRSDLDEGFDHILTEDDIPGASLSGRKPEQLKNGELRCWLRCRGDVGKGLRTKAELAKRVREYITCGCDKNIVDPDPNKIYTRRKENKQTSGRVSEGVVKVDKTQYVKFPDDGWGISLERMPMFSRAEMKLHIMKSGKRIANKDLNAVPTGLKKATTFLKDEYLKDIQSISDQTYFYFKAKCSHSFRKNDPPHNIKVAVNIESGEVDSATCSCVAGQVGYCNHSLALMFKLCKFSLHACKTTNDLCKEDDQTSVAACTFQLQKWHKKGGGTNITPEPVMNVEVTKTKLDKSGSKPGVKSLLYEARVNTDHDFTSEEKLKKDLSTINADMGFSQMMTSTNNCRDIKTVDTKFGKSQVGSLLSYQVGFTESNFTATSDVSVIPRLFNICTQPLTYPRFPLKSLGKATCTKKLSDEENTLISFLAVNEIQINEVERETREQAKCERWKVERKYRFTASRFHLISRRQRNHDKFADCIMYPKPISSKYLERGINYEPIALLEYQKFMQNKKMPMQVLPSGLVISASFPYLAATPDGKVIDTGCKDIFGIVEVKCPLTKFNVTPLDACSDPSFCMEVSNMTCKLKECHPYFAQVQGQMGVTGAMWCDFVVYTKKGINVQRIQFSPDYWMQLQEKLSCYYFSHFIKYAAADFRKKNGEVTNTL